MFRPAGPGTGHLHTGQIQSVVATPLIKEVFMGRPAGWMHKLTGQGAMRSPGAPSHRRETERRFWEQIATGITSEKADYVRDRLEGKVRDADGRDISGPRPAP